MTQEIIDLVEQAKQGSQKAFSKLYHTYKQNIWYVTMGIVKNTDVADDITSVVFAKAYEKLSMYTQHISFEMWLKTIAVNASIDYIRRNKKEQLNNYVDDENSTPIYLSALEKSPEEELVIKEQLERTLKAIPTLKKKHRDLITARINGVSYKDIAKELALSDVTVKSELNKARQKLKEKTNY